MSYQELALLWEQDDIACKAIEAPGAEAFREGFEIEISSEGEYKDLKGDLEDALEELMVEDALETVYAYKRAYGGGAILLGVDDGRTLDKPLDTSRRSKLDFLDVYEPIEIIPAEVYTDPQKPKYGKVEYYRVNTFNVPSPTAWNHTLPTVRGKANRQVLQAPRIHESRLIVFQGIQVSRYLRSSSPISPFWGAPVMPRFYDALRDFQVGFGGAGLLATDVSQPVIAIQGLMQMVGKNEQRFRDRMAALELSRSLARAIVIDADKERYERQTTQLSGIPDLLDRLSQRCAAAIGIPLSILIGYSPATLGKADDSEMKLWYNFVRKVQRRELGPPLKKIATMVMRTLRERKVPKRWRIKWHELERLTTTQLVEAMRVQAQTDHLVIEAGMAGSQELRETRYYGGYSFNTSLNESKQAPGFIAPLPAGLIPKGMSAQAAITAIEAGERPGSPAMAKAGGAGPGAHAVGGYVRKDPKANLAPSPSSGGAAAPESRPMRDAAYTAAAEVAHLRNASARTNNPAAKVLATQLIAIAEAEAVKCADGTCGPDCNYDHTQMDGDSLGELRNFSGMQVVIENPKGSTRDWTDTDGTTGETEMKFDYGYLVDSAGTDGDKLDVYLGPNDEVENAYVVDQMSKASDFALFDEQKVMLGFDSFDAAKKAYISQYNDARFFGGMAEVPVDRFRQMAMNSTGRKV